MRPITIAVGDSGLTKPLKDGSVKANGLELEYLHVSPIIAAMRRMVRGLEFDVCEMAFATYLCARACGKPMTAIPVFLTRGFHHGALFYNPDSGIKHPKDLEGRTVGVNRGYTVTTGIWARGILETEYGVDLSKITWSPTDDEHVAEYQAPANVDYSRRGKSITDLLLSGEIAAAVGAIAAVPPGILPLIPDARSAGFAYFQRTGVYPINHLLVVKDALLHDEPAAAREIFRAFQTAKAIYRRYLDAGKDLSQADESVIKLMAVVGDPFPLGVRANRKAIATVIKFALDQQVIGQEVTPEDIFAPGTVDLEQ